MRGASRTSFAGLTEQLEAENITSATVATRLGDELFAVVGLLDAEHGLRRALSDPGKPAAEKAAVASALLHGKVTGRTESLVVAAVESRWATSGDMVDAIEQLAIEALVLTAEAEDGLDDLEDGLFRFGRVVAAQPELRAALASTSLPADGSRCTSTDVANSTPSLPLSSSSRRSAVFLPMPGTFVSRPASCIVTDCARSPTESPDTNTFRMVDLLLFAANGKAAVINPLGG